MVSLSDNMNRKIIEMRTTGYGTTPVGCRDGSRYVDGFMVLWFLVLWLYGVLVFRFYGFMALWFCSFLVLWFGGFVVLWFCVRGFMVLWFYDFIVLWVFKKYQNVISCLVIDIDPASMVLKNFRGFS